MEHGTYDTMTFILSVCVVRVFKILSNEQSLNTFDEVLAKNSKIGLQYTGCGAMPCPPVDQDQVWKHKRVIHINIKRKSVYNIK